MKKQFIVQKYVMAESVVEALKKAKKLPVHEVFIHNNWFEKNANYEWNKAPEPKPTGFKPK